MRSDVFLKYILLGVCFLLLAAKCASNQASEKIQDSVWYHVSEKDKGDEKYFQKGEENLSLGRREAISFKSNGGFEWQKPGPNDRRITQTGKWKIVDKSKIAVEFDDTALKKMVIKIVSFEGNTLRLHY